MAERPILFTAPMVRAIRAGVKTQTRRLVKPQPPAEAKDAGVCLDPGTHLEVWHWLDSTDLCDASFLGDWFKCPYGQARDGLWVRETHSFLESSITGTAPAVWYWADGNPPTGDYSRPRPSIHMPRKDCRTVLTLEGVRIERLQDISEEDAIAEGILFDARLDPIGPCKWASAVHPGKGFNKAVFAYEELWEHINGAGSWAKNPWVWVLSFERFQDGKNSSLIQPD